MAEETPLADAITAAAGKPKSVQTDGVRVDQHALTDLVAADRHLQSQDSAARQHRGIRLTKLLPPGAS